MSERVRAATAWVAGGGRRAMTACVLGVVAFAVVAQTQSSQGIVRDEVVYMTHGSKYASWWIRLVTLEDDTVNEKTITAHFGGASATANNREHPPLMKTLFGFSEKLLHEELGWTSKVTAYRLPTALMNAILVALVFLLVSGVWGWAEGVVAALLVLLLPRALFHAGLATFDGPIVTMWFATVYAWLAAIGKRWPRSVVVGVVFGLCLATKHNAVLLPVGLLAHAGWLVARRGRAGLRDVAMPLATLVTIAPLVFVAVWPWLWFDTFVHVRDWMQFHLEHVHYNFEYLGRNWNHPPFPWHVAIVTTLLTVPVATLAAGVLGAAELFARARDGDAAAPKRAPALLLFLSAGVSMGPFLLGTTPIFGAEKHWAPAIPTICVFAGIGVVAAGRLASRALAEAGWVREARRVAAERACIAAVAGCVLAAAAVETAAAHPYSLSHYNALAGGAPGGADLGMNRQFWGYAARGVLPFLNERAPARVYTHDAAPAWWLYREEGLAAPGVHDTGSEYRRGIEKSEYAIVIHEKHFNRHDYLIWADYGTVQPVYVLRANGVPIVSVYARPGAAE